MDFKNNEMIADLHLHSRFSRACSKNITIPELVKWAKVKGLNLLGTSDFTHPVWLSEIKDLLVEKNGFYYYQDFPFILSGEISLMYTQEGQEIKSLETNSTSKIRRGRRIHLLLLVPNLEAVDKINAYLDTKGRRDYDGRPIFKIPGDEFVREMMKISKDIEVIPAHIWTPWFGIFGSKSGFDSLKECFKDEIDNIHAIETGMSSDPPMNWRIKELEDKAIVSFSDSHSFWPWRLGREATIFNKVNSYEEIIKQIRENSFVATIETDPGYGIYHYDGHRNCEFSCSPEKTKELGGLCPVCKGKLTLGVDYRVEELAQNKIGFKPENAKPFYKLLPLHELISLNLGFGMQSLKVWTVYNDLIKKFETEFNILLNVSREDLIQKEVDAKLIGLILKNRVGNMKVIPGYDGVYGIPILS
ncbi:DNA helicase UvrD [Candidatus Pacearchaeota archaeon]|nr:DNA helicase UvrD [Candidatus Pacearchaeota archaeon]